MRKSENIHSQKKMAKNFHRELEQSGPVQQVLDWVGE